MTDEQHARWQGYLRDLADRMHLRDWQIKLQRDLPEKESAAAQMLPTYGRKIAAVRLCAEWDEIAPEEQRHCLTHELVHCHLDAAWDMIDADMKGVLGNQAHEVLIWPFRRTMEYGIDALAEVIAPTMPLPPPPTSVRARKGRA